MLIAAVVALFLIVMVGLGLVGVLWLSVTRRTAELGLRRAMGASGVSVRRQVVGELWALTAIAVVVGAVIFLQLPLFGANFGVGWPVFLGGVDTGHAGHLCVRHASAACTRPGWPRGSSRRPRCNTSDAMILIVDDDHAVLHSLELLLKQAGFAYGQRRRSPGGAGASGRTRPRAGAAGHELLPPDHRRGGPGAAARRSRRRRPELPVILITAWGSIELAVQGHEGRRRRLRHQAVAERAGRAVGAHGAATWSPAARAMRRPSAPPATSWTSATTSAASWAGIRRSCACSIWPAGWPPPTPRC